MNYFSDYTELFLTQILDLIDLGVVIANVRRLGYATKLGGSPYMVTRDCCDRMLAATLNDPQTAAMLRKPVITATDEHDVPAMLKELRKEKACKRQWNN